MVLFTSAIVVGALLLLGVVLVLQGLSGAVDHLAVQPFFGVFLNAFNRANFRNPDTNWGRLNAAGDCSPCRAQFGTISGTAPARNIQIGLKVSF